MKKRKQLNTSVTKEYRGWIALKYHGEAYDILFVDSREPLAEQIKNDMHQNGNFLSVRYWISDKEQPIEEVKEEFIKNLLGFGMADYQHRYSDMTGYLWTDEELMVGGHDLLSEIKSYKGKFLHLEIEYNRNNPDKK